MKITTNTITAMKKLLFLFILMLSPMLASAQTVNTQEYYPEGTKWTEIRLDTLKYDSWYSKVGDEWVPNFETIEYHVKGEYTTMYGEKYKCVYTNGPEWTDSLTLGIQEGELIQYNEDDEIIVTAFGRYDDGAYGPYGWAPTYQFDWSIGKGIYFKNLLMSMTTYLVQYECYYGIIDEIKEDYFGGVRQLKYVDLNGKAPECGKYDNPQKVDTQGGRIIQGIGITEWNDGECLFGPPNPYFASTGEGGKRHYRSMLVHFERNGEVLYDVWPKKEVTYRPFVEDNKEWTMAYLGAVPPEYQQTFSYEHIKLGSTLEVDGMTFKQIVSSSWWNDQDGPTNWKETDEYLGEADGKMYLYNKKSQNTVQIMDFTLQVGDTYRQMQMGDPNDYMDFVVTAVTDTVIATSSDKTPRKCLYLSRPSSTKIDDVWIEGIGSLVGGVYGSLVQLMGGAIPSLRKCQIDGQTLYEVYHPFLKEGKTWNYEEYYRNGEPGEEEEWTRNISYVLNGTTEIDGKTYYKMYRVTEEGSEYYCALREEDRKVWMHSSNSETCLLYDFGMSLGDRYKTSVKEIFFQLSAIKPMRFQYNQLLNVLYYDIYVEGNSETPDYYFYSTPIVEGVGCDAGWNFLQKFEPVLPNLIYHRETFKSCYEDGQCIFTADDFNKLPKPDLDIPYRPFIEEDKVWKVGTIPSSPDSPVQIVDYYYFDGDTIVDGKTYKQMWCQRYVSSNYPDYDYMSQQPSLSKVGAWYEENQKVYFYNEEHQIVQLKYDFSLDPIATLDFLNGEFVIGPKLTGLEGFKGVYRDIMTAQNGDYCTTWLEGVGDVNGPTRYPCDPILGDPVPEFLMSCTVGDEVIYLNDEYEDGATPKDMAKKRFDFTHTTKLQPKNPRRGEEELSLYGEYNALQLGIHLDPLDDAYQVRITNESGKAVYEKTVNAGTIVGLSIDISAYAKGRYTVTVENNNELFTGEFETETTGIEETIYNKVETKTDIYNLQGQRIHSLQKGLNIYGGRKIVK
jgi:hypothetical protein